MYSKEIYKLEVCLLLQAKESEVNLQKVHHHGSKSISPVDASFLVLHPYSSAITCHHLILEYLYLFSFVKRTHNVMPS